MLTQNIGFIGGGNMARSLIGGLLARGLPPGQVRVADPVEAQRQSLQQEFGIFSRGFNVAIAKSVRVVVLAVKPQEMRAVATEIAPSIAATRPTVISIAAGVRVQDLQQWLGNLPVVRCMPNRPALNGAGVTALFAAADVGSDSRDVAETILGAVGPALWVDREELMDVVTAVSGSGPAYFFLLVEMLESAGTALGLSPDTARRLAVETAYGSGCMARTASESPAALREQVTSKGGTTEAALRVLEAANVRAIFAAAVTAAAARSAELAELTARPPAK